MQVYLKDNMELLKTIPTGSVDLVIMDPPYDIETKGGRAKFGNLQNALDEIDFMVDSYDIEGLNRELIRVMKKINIYIWCNKKQIPEYLDLYVNKLGCYFDLLVWNKTNPVPAYNKKHVGDAEYCLLFREKGTKLDPKSIDDARTVMSSPANKKDKDRFGHPTIKPLWITERMIRNSSNEWDTVLDPFMGSGTTAEACINLNRHFIGSEVSEEVFEIASKRIQEAMVMKGD